VLIDTLRVPKMSGSYADTLVAVGVADLVAELAHHDAQVSIRDEGGVYIVTVTPALDTDTLGDRGISPGYTYLLVKRDDGRAPLVGNVFHYEEQKEREGLARAASKAARSSKAKRVAEQQGVEVDFAIDPELQVFKIYNSMRVGSDTFNQVHDTLRHTPDLPRLVAERLERLASSPAAPPAPTTGESLLTKVASNLQFWSPIGGKGVNRSKPNGTNLGSLPDSLVDWFTEWMKFRALRRALLAYRIGDDFKVFVLAPGDIPLHLLGELRRELLRRRIWGSSIKLDIEVALTLARLLVLHSPASEASGADFSDPVWAFFSRSTPRQVVRGLASAYFKSLGGASATMNVSFLGLPGWFPVDTPERVADWLAILDEYGSRLRGFREKEGGGGGPPKLPSHFVQPLLAFRDFISSGRLEDGLEFFGLYAALLPDAKDGLRPFRADNLRRVVMAYASEDERIVEIIENPGFKSVARAIRASTIKAQIAQHKRTGPPRVDIRYGLAQDWKRSVERKAEFIEKVADFVASYNAEAARRQEKGEPSEWLISADDLESLVRLVASSDSALVGRLLIAFGYASDWKRQTGDRKAGSTPDESGADETGVEDDDNQ